MQWTDSKWLLIVRMRAKKIGLAAAVFVLAAGTFIAGIYAQRSRLPRAGFLQSTAAVIRLGVWDKQGVAKTNKATFLVTAPDGQKSTAVSTEPLDNWVYKEFPDDFSPYPEKSGVYTNYTWECIVDGRAIAGGKFAWGNDRADDNNRNLR